MFFCFTNAKQNVQTKHIVKMVLEGDDSDSSMSLSVGTTVAACALLIANGYRHFLSFKHLFSSGTFTIPGSHIPTRPEIYKPILDCIKREGVSYTTSSVAM